MSEGGANDVPPSDGEPPAYAFEVYAASDMGTERGVNEDHCGTWVKSATSVLVVVADGVSGYQGGETASRTAVGTLVQAYQEQPTGIATGKRLYRAAQQANKPTQNSTPLTRD